MARDNNFVVIERVKDLEQTTGDLTEEDPTVMAYNVALWPGKPTKKPVVPGERMRMKLERAGVSEECMDAHVILADELRDVCVGLSIFQRPQGKYLTSGLSASINVHKPTYTETAAARDNRERALLEPLQKLRHLADVSVRGTLPAIDYQISRQLTHPTFDRGLVLTTIDELINTGDQASSNGEYGIATAHYQRASEYFHHSATHEGHVFTHPADVLALEFKIMQHQSRNWIEAGQFSDALEAAQIALYFANQLFQINSPMITGPPTDANGSTSAEAFRRSLCEWIKDGAARYGQRIKCEDVGRCYYYKSISAHMVPFMANIDFTDPVWDWHCRLGHLSLHGMIQLTTQGVGMGVTKEQIQAKLGQRCPTCAARDAAEETAQAENDKLTAIGCCVVSDTMKENVPAELLQLDKRMMEKLSGRSGEEGEEEEGDDEGWVDEEWETDESEEED